jgi:hypothetical protein
MATGARIELVVDASLHGGEPGQTLSKMVEAPMLTLRPSSDLLGDVGDHGDDRHRVALT